MTMTRKELEELRTSNKLIKLLQQKIRQLEDMVTSVNPSYSDMPKGSAEQDKMGNCVAQIIDFKDELESQIMQQIQRYKLAQESIDRIANINNRLVLSYRYLLNYNFTEIAEIMDYDIRSIYKIHERAIALIDKQE